jgi:hypothetical protein
MRTLFAALVCTAASVLPLCAAELDPRTARMLDDALQQLEKFRKESHRLQYDAAVEVKEWDGHGELRGTAKAQMVVRPGDTRPISYVSREVHGKVKLPDANERAKPEDKDDTALQQFARNHRINDRFEFTASDDSTALGPARRVEFSPKPRQPEKSTADRFLDAIGGSAWISEGNHRLAKFQMQLHHPFQLFWILAVLRELSIEYELLQPDEYLGRARLHVRFCVATPIYTIRQEHEAELSNFRPRQAALAAR